ncbi:hypothetical protein SCARR_00120 [Pontiella sulfatireligans]|uniref:Uracil-DNA glycosylase-like domain-containing protein n=2 Tax=Pontiella sulfatireligans TaxID=2750658 RepID=A0A6C2UDU8_9BACT|nr:hypothetical protein SCARR_00120 [Pontiella sulfatireligans]
MKCRHCFNQIGVEAPLIDIAQPRWIGSEYWKASPKVLILMLNPGSGESRKDDADTRFRNLLHAYAAGDGGLEEIFAHQGEDIPNWGRGRLSKFYLGGFGLELEKIAFGNIAWCATRRNKYPARMLCHCFEQHTSALVRLLMPDVVILSGKQTHRFATAIREMVPNAKVIETIHYAHRGCYAVQNRELARVRKLIHSEASEDVTASIIGPDEN